MGSKYRLLPWIASVFETIEFDSAMDPFLGSGAVAYLMKGMGKRVIASDYLNFTTEIAKAAIENHASRATPHDVEMLICAGPYAKSFIHDTFDGVFYDTADLRFLDTVCANIPRLDDPYKRNLATAALIRACVKKQPRGVFTVGNNGGKYDDGRRDLRLTMRDQFLEQIDAYNDAVFDNGKENLALRSDVFDLPQDLVGSVDLVYLDPPYVPRSDDNDYIKRYHFLEGISTYWKEDAVLEESKVKKIPKRFTPFAYRKTAIEAFERLFAQFRDSTIVLSYSSNGYPDLEVLVELMSNFKSDIVVHRRDHRYHFGTHKAVRRSIVEEYLIVGK
ncbi:MAG: DNA methyltransferase [Spirochaetaceae bacterium]|nr:MAG: DNA methyltransferase [Spirochaetaceae bacterium]